jgi:hypothetical protein
MMHNQGEIEYLLDMPQGEVRGTLTVTREAWERIGCPGSGELFQLAGWRYATGGVTRSQKVAGCLELAVRRLHPV